MANNLGFKPISDYAAIGNLRTVALIGRDGSIDWCCFSHMDCPSVFAAILDVEKGGRFRVAPVGAGRGEQRYLEDTNVLETIFRTGDGQLTVADFMPLWGDIDHGAKSKTTDEIIRIVSCDVGQVDVQVEWSPRPDYARADVTIEQTEGGWIAITGDVRLALDGLKEAEVVDSGAGPTLRGRLKMRGGDKTVLVTRWNSDSGPLRLEEALQALERTTQTWRAWVRKEQAKKARGWAGKWLDQVIRSELALKLLTHADTGAIAAAPTTSLPEHIGGVRNWDYRFTWIRDAALTIQALSAMGHETEALDFLYWAERVSAEHLNGEDDIQIMYGLHGETDLDEYELGHLSGYRNSQPVRAGNGAAKQLQLDVYGELLDSGYEILRRGHELEPKLMGFLNKVADRACDIWQQPDYGIWEMRGEPRHFVYSKVMAWVALERAVVMAENYGLEGNLQRWRNTQEAVRKEVLRRGYNREVNSFTQSFDTEEADAANLLIPMHEFISFDDPRTQGTIDRVINELEENGLVYRYRTDDGLPGEEGAFGLCTFWLVDALALSGRVDEAWEIFEGIAKRANHVELFSEQIDAKTGDFLGNFPQAFTHIGFINSMLFLGYAEGKDVGAPPLVGTPEHRAQLARKEG